MNNRQIITVIVIAIAALVAGYFIGTNMNEGGEIQSESQITLDNQSDSLNYFLGLSLGYDLGGAPWDADAGLVASGMNQVLNDTSSYDQMTAQSVFRELNMALQNQQSQQAEVESAENLQRGEEFLVENAQREGVNTTESGLQYEVIEQGDGPTPTDTSTVSVMYEGTLIDGTIFDSSYETNDTVTFALNNVIPGWTEGLQLMPVGSTYKFYIPADLAYGERATGPIPGNSVLIFRVELLGIE